MCSWQRVVFANYTQFAQHDIQRVTTTAKNNSNNKTSIIFVVELAEWFRLVVGRWSIAGKQRSEGGRRERQRFAMRTAAVD